MRADLTAHSSQDGREPGRANPLQARTAETGLTSSSGCRFPGSASTFFMAVIDWRDYVDEETKKPPRPYALARFLLRMATLA